ncbi:SDR family oxidoreductase [Rugosimonospora acidiphila]|uniref:SDR family oxidoreductase n=1 Tax=Rugosimonospora acidiphila TaxID=556531 RepID=A0ABP9RLZ0_9ACTN
MIIAITGAAGPLGRLVIDELLGRGVPASDIIAAVGDPQKATDLADRGLQVRQADYDQQDTLCRAFLGADRLLLISSSEAGHRREQHRNVIDAALSHDIRQIAYTSILHADSSDVPLAAEHRATEDMIRESRIPFAFLRNSWYVENYTSRMGQILDSGVIIGAAGDGRVAAAGRADYAAATASVLAGSGTGDAVYELGGDEPFTLTELADEISRQTGTEVVYRDMPPDDYAKALINSGMPDSYATAMADADVGLSKGELDTDSGDLTRLAGRPTTSLADAVSAGLKR